MTPAHTSHQVTEYFNRAMRFQSRSDVLNFSSIELARSSPAVDNSPFSPTRHSSNICGP